MEREEHGMSLGGLVGPLRNGLPGSCGEQLKPDMQRSEMSIYRVEKKLLSSQ